VTPPLSQSPADSARQLQALAEASLAVTTELTLDGVLQKIAEVARGVLQAQYAALGVINESGTGLSRFVTAGIDETTKARIGPLPTGRGLLGQLITERRPLRIRVLATHPQSAGFPPNHPPMGSFLGVPIMVREKAYGNLYVTEKRGAEEFSEADEAIALMLASQAGIAIENAHAFEALQRAQEELVRNERLAALGQLAGGVGHELRNPLGVIKNAIFYLNMALPADEKIRKHFAIIEREIATATRIVGDLLDYARVREPMREPIDLGALMREAVERLAAPPTVRVQVRLDDTLGSIMADPVQLGQIVNNLLTNAIQAMPEGGLLAITSGSDGDQAVIAVEDTGVGIAPENLSRIFQPLFTTKAKGIGLGLALASNLATAHGGGITVQSTPGRGSRFTLRVHKGVR
jgi:signal transduction histidine kinase